MDGFKSVLDDLTRALFKHAPTREELEQLKTELPKLINGRIAGMQINHESKNFLKSGIYACPNAQTN